jgi:hypothetical protein
MPLTKIQSLGITDGTIVNADINASAAIAGTKISGSFGKVLQVVQVTKTDILSTTSTSFIDATGLSASITPSSASNKILMTVSVPFGASTRAFFKLVRGSTDILLGDSAGSRIPANFHGYGDATVGDAFYALQMFSFSVLDTPSTTSSTTYKIQWRMSTGGTIYINRDGDDTNNTEHSRSASTIILMEIAA